MVIPLTDQLMQSYSSLNQISRKRIVRMNLVTLKIDEDR